MDVERYFQPYQQGDKITLQWLGIDDAPPVATYTITLLDQYGQTIKQQDADLGAEVGTGSGIFIRECEMLLYDVPEGKYFVQIRKVGLLGAYNFLRSLRASMLRLTTRTQCFTGTNTPKMHTLSIGKPALRCGSVFTQHSPN